MFDVNTDKSHQNRWSVRFFVVLSDPLLSGLLDNNNNNVFKLNKMFKRTKMISPLINEVIDRTDFFL